MIRAVAVLIAAALLAVHAEPGSALPIPDPEQSECVLPEQDTLCGAAFSIQVVSRSPTGQPLEASTVWAEFELVSGAVTLPEPVAVYADDRGFAQLDFPDGLTGEGEVRIRVYADGVVLCTSPVYLVDPDCAVPVRALTWSALKRVWPSSR